MAGHGLNTSDRVRVERLIGRVVRIDIPRGGDPHVDHTIIYTDDLIDQLNGQTGRVIGLHRDGDGRAWAHIEGFRQADGFGYYPFLPDWLTVVEV